MKTKIQVVNWFAFFFGAALPFFGAWANTGHTLGNDKQVLGILVVLYLFVGKGYLRLNPARNSLPAFGKYYFGFIALAFLSFALTNPDTVGISQFETLLSVAVIYLLLSELCFLDDTIRALYRGLMAGFLLCVFIATMQFLRISSFDIFKPEDLNANTSYTDDGGAVDMLRVWGPFGNALTFSFYLAVAGVILVAYAAFVRRSKKYAWLVAAAALAGIAFTISRTATAAFLVCAGLLIFLTVSRKSRSLLIAGMVIVLIAGFAYLPTMIDNSPLLSRLNESSQDFEGGRLALWEVGYKAWMQEPFLGTGPGNLNKALYINGWRTMPDDILNTTPGHVESFYLTTLFTFGILCFLLYMIFLVSFIRSSYRVFQAGLREKAVAMGIPVFGGLICILINNAVDPAMIFDFRIQLMMVILMVIGGNTYKRLVALEKTSL